MSDEIAAMAERLRNAPFPASTLGRKAADLIEQLQAERDRLRNISAGMFWCGGAFDDKTISEIQELGLAALAERDRYAALLDELIAWSSPPVGSADAYLSIIASAKALRE